MVCQYGTENVKKAMRTVRLEQNTQTRMEEWIGNTNCQIGCGAQATLYGRVTRWEGSQRMEDFQAGVTRLRYRRKRNTARGRRSWLNYSYYKEELHNCMLIITY